MASATGRDREPTQARAWSTFGPHAIGTERFATVSNGLQRHVVLPGHRCDPGETSPGQNPDKDEVTDPWDWPGRWDGSSATPPRLKGARSRSHRFATASCRP